MDIKSDKDRITKLLELRPHLRDDDNKIIANIWTNDLALLNIDARAITGFELLEMVSKGKLTNPESIRRCRQKIQETHVELRGENRTYKKEVEEKVVKKYLEDFSSTQLPLL